MNVFLGNMKQTKGCTNCGGTVTAFDNMKAVNEDESVCTKCGQPLEYIGLQPHQKVVMKQEVDEALEVALEAERLKELAKPVNTPKESEQSEGLTLTTTHQTALISRVNVGDLQIGSILDISGRVSNKQMIPAIKEALELDSMERLALLQSSYPKAFEGSKKYVGKKNIEKLTNMLNK